MKTNLDWLKQYIRESQAKYPSISNNYTDVLNHVFFVNGNGVELEDGLFVQYVGFNRTIPFEWYYANQKSFEDCCSVLSDDDCYVEKEVQWIYDSSFKPLNTFKKVHKPDEALSDNDLYSKAYTKFSSRYDNVVSIDSVESWDSEDVIYESLLAHKYEPYLNLSPEYFKLDKFNEKTSKELVNFAITYCRAVIRWITVYEEGRPIKGLFGKHSKDHDYVGTWRKDKEILSNIIARLESFL